MRGCLRCFALAGEPPEQVLIDFSAVKDSVCPKGDLSGTGACLWRCREVPTVAGGQLTCHCVFPSSGGEPRGRLQRRAARSVEYGFEPAGEGPLAPRRSRSIAPRRRHGNRDGRDGRWRAFHSPSYPSGTAVLSWPFQALRRRTWPEETAGEP